MGAWKRIRRIIFIILFGIGCITVTLGALDLYWAYLSTSWPSVSGTVVSADIVTYRSYKASQSSFLTVEYQYEVQGAQFRNQTISFGAFDHLNDKEGDYDRLMNAFPKGKQIPVFYHPDDPSRSVLVPGIGLKSYEGIGLGLAFLISSAIPFALW